MMQLGAAAAWIKSWTIQHEDGEAAEVRAVDPAPYVIVGPRRPSGTVRHRRFASSTRQSTSSLSTTTASEAADVPAVDPAPYVIVVHHDGEAAEVRAVDPAQHVIVIHHDGEAAEVPAVNPAPHVMVVVHHDNEAAEVRTVDQHGNVIKCIWIRQPIVGPLSMHGDLLCASHGWGRTSVVNMVTGAVTDVAVDPRKKVNSATPYCVLGHVPATGEYKVLRIQADDLGRRWRQMCEVVTLGGSGDAGRWRRLTPPPVTLSIGPGSSSWNGVVVAGLAYFRVCRGQGDDYDVMQADSMAVFDLETEEWKPATLRGPLTSSFLAGTDEDKSIDPIHRRRHPPYSSWFCLGSLMKRFQLARLGDSLVVVYCNVEDNLTELWFLEDMDDVTAPRWSRRYTLQGTEFEVDETWKHKYFRISAKVKQYHYPLAVLDDGRILVWVDRMSALKSYDPETGVWTDLGELQGGGSVLGLHHGSFLCSIKSWGGPGLRLFY